MPFLDDCARTTTNTLNRIDYQKVRPATKDDLGLLSKAVVPRVESIVRRQAVLQALEDEGHSAGVLALCANDSGPLASSRLEIRSSHSGAPIDRGLPQGPYGPAALPAGVAANQLRARANYAWLQASTTDHTTKPAAASGLQPDPARVASYFEVTLPEIGRTMQLVSGGRILYDPFHHRFFISEHYRSFYELIGVPAVTADPDYAALRQELHAFAPTPTETWDDEYDSVIDRIRSGRY
ncbi:hypothetical protein OG455_30895 [Kitasatospora sp. NBC_01287]|uniref:hypothetical protein n=1 Tax=Kitasatospora sp. NBC_01287 TaxID=2903573 RepID=UPI002258AD35|nr:hypothetical protein [Kitasatospora sp. NBC_01287]MCX4749873.1 hypothetical protein [Kitasatospora sp. NBC_01287]